MLKYLTIICVFLVASSEAMADWRFQTDGMITGKAVITKDSIFVTGGEKLYSLSKSGSEQWSYDAGAPTFSSVATKNDRIYMLADNGLHALDLSGKNIWTFKTNDSAFKLDGSTMGWGEGDFIDPWSWYRSSPLIVGNLVIFGTTNGTQAIDALTGKSVWHSDTGISHTKPAYSDGIVVIGSWNNTLYGLNEADGKIIWAVPSKLPEGSMAGWKGWEGFNLDPIIHKDIIYVGNRGTHFYALALKTGIEEWTTKHPTSWIGSPAIVSGDVVYYGLSDGYSLKGHQIGMGNQMLLFRNNFYNFAQPEANETHIFMPSVSGELFAINKTTGQGKKIFSTEKSIENLHALLKPTGGMLSYFTKKEGYNHSSATKDVKRMLSKLNGLLSITREGDTLYIGSANGVLYSLSLK